MQKRQPDLAIYQIEGTSIEDTWYKALVKCIDHGTQVKIDKGEFQGENRFELDFAVLKFKRPWLRPLACQLPCYSPSSDTGIEQYFYDYLLNPEITDEQEILNNEYKYSSFIAPLWQHCCDLLLHGEGGCNQATISLGDIYTKEIMPGVLQVKPMKHPPCLRMIDMRLRYGALHFILAFRSWDLLNGLPTNIGGLQLLKESCLEYINLNRLEQNKSEIKDGVIIATSKGLHIYEHSLDLIRPYVYNGSWSDDSDCLDVNVL